LEKGLFFIEKEKEERHQIKKGEYALVFPPLLSSYNINITIQS
jgi:hypothetical protein